VPREIVHEAASALGAGGNLPYGLLAARTSGEVAEACAAYSALQQVDLTSAAVILDEGVAALDATGSEQAKADTFVGLLLAAFRRGAHSLDLVEVLDAGWPRVETALSSTTLVLLLEELQGPLAVDNRWPPRFVPFLAEAQREPLHGAVLTVCARFLEQGGGLGDQDRDTIANALCRIGPWRLQPAHVQLLLTACADRIHPENASRYGPIVARAGAVSLEWWARRDPVTCTALLGHEACAALVPCNVLEHLWDWAIEHRRPDVVRALLALNLTPEGSAFRQRLVERLIATLLSSRRGQPHQGT
jgi:hypothetical protein